MKARLGPALRVLGCTVFVALFLRNADLLDATWHRLQGARIAWFVAAVAALFVSLWCTAVRQRILLRAVGNWASVRGLFRDLLRGTALNAASLMGVGEAYRALQMTRFVPSRVRAAALVLGDRLIGISVVGAVGIVFWSLFAVSPEDGTPVEGGPVLAAGAIATLALGVLVISALLVLRRSPQLRQLVEDLRRNPLGMAQVVAMSCVVCACWICSVWAISESLGLDTPLSAYSYVAPTVSIATMLPISVGGIGVRETGYVVLLDAHGVASDSAVALGLLQYATFLCVALGGAVTWLRLSPRGRS